MALLNDADWLRRYKQRLMDRAGFTQQEADTFVDDGETIAEKAEFYEDDPEGAADDEMSYWSD